MAKVAMLPLFLALGLGSCMAVNTCISDGKFIADTNCTSFVVCIQNVTEFISYSISCPAGFHVRYQNMVCSKNTDCDPNYSCTSLGNFSNPTSASQYISCVQGLGDIIIALSKECTAPLLFNAVSGICEEIKIPTTLQPEITTISTGVPANGRAGAEVITGIPPTFTTTQTITLRAANGSGRNFATHFVVFSIVCYNILARQLNINL